ncbi:hypothetical protein NEHOM01_0186 [Nematocida homosporus]|uniref:uncharacterized protein n=1 Tax=Nematocida homosporus TaxID=1912981 RepID=UPI00221ECCDD|nr:uncharacterized protein NEHOM01_0186 [Nematocida homosporus]KAI5184511.1 hypothetical protein NEHOM01_0186 [Nematocida homosporus]
MNKRLNEYSLNVYQVVCLVIGLCCVWCSSDEDSYTNATGNIFKRLTLDIDSQIESKYAAMTETINNLKFVRNKQSTRINQIKQRQQNLEKEEQKASENMNATQSGCSFSDKSKNLVGQKKVELISQLVREEIIRQSLDIIAQQMDQWLSECKNIPMPEESPIESIRKLEKIAKRLIQVNSNLKGPQNQSPNAEISLAKNGLIAIDAQYNPHELKSRIKVIIIEELTKILPKIDTLGRDDITQVMDPVVDQLLKHDELESLGNISRIIEEALVQLDNRSKNMKVKSESESKQEPTDSEPSTSRTQSSNPQTNKSGMDGKPHSSRKSAG